MCAVAAMVTCGANAFGTIGHFESFETSADSWNAYQSDVTRVASGTNGVTSFDGDYHMTITDPAEPGEDYFSGTYSWLGGRTGSFGNGFSTSAAVYIDLTDSQVQGGTYGFDLSQAIYKETDSHAQDNIYHIGAFDLENTGTYSVLLGASHNSNFAPQAGSPYTTITESGWYTFEYSFAASATVADSVDIEFAVYDAEGDLFWSQSEVSNPAQYTLSNVEGNGYMWFTFVNADSLAVDAVSMVPEPATMALLGLGGLAMLRKRK